jgi:hypothetical protein
MQLALIYTSPSWASCDKHMTARMGVLAELSLLASQIWLSAEYYSTLFFNISFMASVSYCH